MNVLVIGAGAREHALAWKIGKSAGVRQVLCAPGNTGIARQAECVAVEVADVAALAALAQARHIDLTVVGPEASLAAGVADRFESLGLPLFGATRAAAEIESSKAFAKEFMRRHGVPTAAHDIVSSPSQARAVLARRGPGPVVLKADGLAAGKGVVVAADRDEADRAIDAMLIEKRFGAAGETIVIEDRLVGPEVSFFVLSDGERAMALTTCQDYKRLLDGDRGPNTGGMGGYSPSILFDANLERRVMETIVAPTLRGLRAEGRPYRGVLYVGLMLTATGPQVLEYNARFGDPEAELLCMRMQSDLVSALQATLAGRLDEAGIVWHPGAAVCIVLAAAGYPGTARTGVPIEGLGPGLESDGVQVFHAATRLQDGVLRTAGGRVLAVTARGATYAQAAARAYACAGRIRFEGRQCRSDIARIAIESESA